LKNGRNNFYQCIVRISIGQIFSKFSHFKICSLLLWFSIKISQLLELTDTVCSLSFILNRLIAKYYKISSYPLYTISILKVLFHFARKSIDLLEGLTKLFFLFWIIEVTIQGLEEILSIRNYVKSRSNHFLYDPLVYSADCLCIGF